MISVIRTDSGRFNVIGTDSEADVFILQGNLTLKELKELKTKINQALKEAS